MKDEYIVVSETQRPFWHLIIAALLFTLALSILCLLYYTFSLSFQGLVDSIYIILGSGFISIVASGFCSQKYIYIDLENSKFKPSLEIGFIKIGKWKIINNYEYVSVFYDPGKSESEIFEVNLWYDRNKHFEIYTRNNFHDAINVGYNLSEKLNIDLLDATIRGDHKWIDKEDLKLKTNE